MQNLALKCLSKRHLDEPNLASVKFEKIGSVGGDKFKLNDIEEKLSDVSEVYFNKFAAIIRQED